MNFHDLLDEVEEREMLVNNLFQLDNGTWRCSLRSKRKMVDGKSHFFAMAEADTPEGALKGALEQCLNT